MKKDSFLSAMGDVNQDFIAEYEKARKARRVKLITRITAMAASVCLVIGATALSLPLLVGNESVSKTEEPAPLLQNTGPTVSDSQKEPDEITAPDGPFTMLSITPEKMNGDYVACDSDFIVEATNATADLVREHLYISGGPEYTVTKESEGKYRVSIQGNLSSGNVVSLSYANDGVTEYSWAFETERELKVTASLPANGAAKVDATSAIRLEFSMATDTTLTDCAVFSPHVDGKWEQFGKIHQFIPASPLADDTVYTLTVKAGVTAGEYTMENDYTLSFDTGAPSYTTVLSPYIHDIYNYTTEQTPVIRYSSTALSEPAERVVVSTFESCEDMLAFTESSRQAVTSGEREVSFTEEELTGNKRQLTLPALEEGCYLVCAYRSDSVHPFLRAAVQINDLSAYVAVTNNDLIVWSDRQGLTAEYNGVAAVTDESGIAILEDAADSSSSVSCVTLSEGGDVQLALVPDLAASDPEGYIYCDKPIYRTTDTVSFFGAVPLPLFEDGAVGTFAAELCFGGSTVLSVPVKLDENGAYSGTFSYSDLYSSSFEYLRLTYNGSELARRYIVIEDYYLDNYTFTLEPVTDNLISEGESYDFGVKVVHISGVPVQGKELRARVGDDEFYYAVTDGNGVAHFSIPHRFTQTGPSFETNSQYSCVSVTVSSNDVTDAGSYDCVVSTRFCTLNAEYTFDTDCTSELFRAQALRFKTEADALVSAYYPEDDDAAVERGQKLTGEVSVRLIHKTREKLAVTVDENTGKTKGIYSDTVGTYETAETFTFELTELYELDLTDYVLPEADEYNSYCYSVSYTLYNADGTVSESHEYTAGNNSFTDPYASQDVSAVGDVTAGEDGYSGTLEFDSYYNAHTYGYNFADEEYHTYRYSYEAPYSVGLGETVDFTVTDTVTGKELTEGTLLRILYRDGILRADVVEADSVDFEYTEDLGPFFKVTLAYLKDGCFYRMAEATVCRKKEERTLTVTAQTDKDSYSPGEQVTVTLSVTDCTGAPVSCTVNLSVVNEALLKNNYHRTDIMSSIDSSLYNYRLFTYSSYFDAELNGYLGGYGGGGGETARVDFDDTACFETVTTDGNGTAKITFTLPDSVTEYRITAHAVTADMRYGVSESSLTASMPFFLQSVEGQGLKSTDDFVPSVNSVSTVGYGTVNYTFTVKELGESIDAYAFTGAAAQVNFGKLEAGTYTLRIDATFGEYKDAVEYPFTVSAGAMHDAYTESLKSGDSITFTPYSYPVKVSLYTSEAEFYLSLFDYMDSLPATRSDNAVSAYCADRLYNSLIREGERVMGAALSSAFTDRNGLISLYAQGGADYVVSAMTAYYQPSLIDCDLPMAEDSYSYVLSLMVRAAMGETVLNELKAAEPYADGDDTLTAALGAAYAMLGDYDSAKRTYISLPERSEEAGADALRAFIATFVDRDNAGVILQDLITEEPDERYLGFAVVSYMTRRIMSVTEERTLTLTVNGNAMQYTVSGITPLTLTYFRQETPDFTVSLEGEGVCASVTYRAAEKSGEGDYYMWLEGDFTKNSIVYLVFDADSFSGSITLNVALPPSLRLLSKSSLGGYVRCAVQGERLRISLDDRTTGTLRIPLLTNASGNYHIEPIRLTTENGNNYYSNEIIFDTE